MIARNDKSPGNDDGITVEFYKTFWSQLRPPLLESFNYSYKANLLPLSQRQSVITIIEKKDSDSLLNVDYKTLSKVLASRIKKTLPTLIHDSQTGYVENR